MAKTFSIDQNAEIARYLQLGFEKAAERAILASANKLVSHIQNEVIPAIDPKPVDRGIYRSGWRAKAIKGGAEVSNNVPHASIIEEGARAANIKIGRRMIDALASWVRRKGLVKGKGRQAQEDSRSVAWAIASAMKKKGIFNRNGEQGLHVLDKGLKKLGDFVAKEFRVEIEREFTERG